ncbi:MAG: hypothetical protein ACKVT0_12215, partial [Planctomycetaceae bacterium]
MICNPQLVNNGQTLNKTEDLFRELHQRVTKGYAMMIHHDDRPLFSRKPRDEFIPMQSRPQGSLQ